MKHIKLYDNYNSQLKHPTDAQLYDYVICEDIAEEAEAENIINFIRNNIGQIIHIPTSKSKYIVKYENIPDNLLKEFNPKTNARVMFNDEIKYCSENKETLELILNQKKFNL
jgi:phosphomannomutase